MVGMLTTLNKKVNQLSRWVSILRIMRAVLLTVGKIINIEREKERKTAVVLDWNWRNQNELIFFQYI